MFGTIDFMIKYTSCLRWR